MKRYDGVIFDWRDTLVQYGEQPHTLFSDTLPTLDKLHRSFTFSGVISDVRAETTHTDMRRLRFPLHRLSFIQTPEDTPAICHRSDPALLIPAIGRLEGVGLRRDRMVYIGDHVDDLRAADAADIDFMAVTTGITTAEEFAAAGAYRVVSSLSEAAFYL